MSIDKSLLYRPYLSRPAGSPSLIGLLQVAAGIVPYALSERDVTADAAWANRVYDLLGLAPGQTIHLVGDGCEELLWWPFENAAMRRRIPWVEAEGGVHDAARTDMVLRRFSLQAVLGITEPVIDKLQELGRDLGKMFGTLRAVSATPSAAERLRRHGIPVWTQLQLGPIFAFEPPTGGGALFDECEWLAESIDGEVVLTAMHDRATPFTRLRTGVRGAIERVDISGRRESRIVLCPNGHRSSMQE